MTEKRHGDRAAFVTGAGSGIGRAISQRLAQEGASVACVDIDVDGAQESVALIERAGGRALALMADVRDRAAVRLALETTVAQFGPIHYLVNNAGVVTMSSLEDLTDEEWDLVMDVNLKGCFVVSQSAIPHMARDGRAAVVNLSTVEAHVIVASRGFCQPHYNASKGGVMLLTKALALELSRYGIRVNSVAPGPVATGFIPGVDPENIEVPQSVLDRLLIRRLAKPDDIAAAVSFLLSADASYITGAELVVDGGWLVR
ncbi:MAG: SDR family NAD(P)-dependent oxidoreductase [Candidatus Dormibacteria bacterium]